MHETSKLQDDDHVTAILVLTGLKLHTCAIVMHISASVTVSIGELMTGAANLIFFVT
jgi:hypothetical protein